ncbi:MAG: hypothetical protein M3N43_08365 [Actinomycetota bacterium]|nr:hypothetical protein [Actinomycetota bacterium]
MSIIPTAPRTWAPELPAALWHLEKHPTWCHAPSVGCGLHYGVTETITAQTTIGTDGFGTDVHTAPIMDAVGQVGVSLSVELLSGGCANVRLTTAEARQVAANLVTAADTADAPTERAIRVFPEPTRAGAR